MTLTLVGFPSDVRLEDHASGIRILGQESDRPRSLSVTALVWDALAGAAVAAIAVLILLAICGPIVLSALDVQSLTVGTSGTFTYVFSFVNTPTEISMGVGPGVLGLGAAVGLLYAFVRSHQRKQKPPTESDRV